MTEGVRVVLRVGSPTECPVATATSETGGRGGSVSWTNTSGGENRVVEEFELIDAEEELTMSDDSDPPITHVHSYESHDVYRFSHDTDQGCPCAIIERSGCPIADVTAKDGDLLITFNVSDISQIQSILEQLRSEFSGLSVERLIQSEPENSNGNLVVIDKAVLTDRQTEVLETALEMGYFHHPKRANAGEVAHALDINRSTFGEHLAAGLGKLLTDTLAE